MHAREIILISKLITHQSHANTGGVWYMFSNNNFQFLNNITHISTHYFHPHIYPNMFLNNNFQILSACTKHLRNVTIVLQVVLPTFNI